MRTARRAMAIAAVASLLAQIAIADTIVLLDGTQIEGAVANREHVAQSPGRLDYVAILPYESEELRRIPVNEISYVVLIDGEVQRVIEFGRTTAAKPAREDDLSASFLHGKGKEKRTDSLSSRRQAGVLLVALGAAAIGVGAFVKFGGPKATITSNSIDVDEKSYNFANGALIVGGVLLIVGGVATYSSGKKASQYSVVLPSGNVGVGLAVRF